MHFSAILSSLMTIIFIEPYSTKNIFNEVFYKVRLQKMSTNPPITPDLYRFTEEILDGKFQNLQNFP